MSSDAAITKEEPWFENDEFWQITEPYMFSEERIAKTPGEVDAVLALVGTLKGTHLLDLCCGVGRHSLEFARRQFTVTGVDRFAAHLEKAKNLAIKEGLNINWVQSDMGKFIQANSFDLAISMFTSFSYFQKHEDNLQVLKNVYTSLKLGGSFLIEMVGKEVLAMNWSLRDWSEKNGVIIAEERSILNDWSQIESRWVVIVDGQAKEFRVRHWLYSPSDLSSMLKESGFGTVQIFGSLAGTPYDHTATRLIAVARKD